jgi:hypothetical protein
MSRARLVAVQEDENTRKAQKLKYDINLARYNYAISYERQKVAKRRDRFSLIFPIIMMCIYLVFWFTYSDVLLKYLPYVTEQTLALWYPSGLYVVVTLLAIPLSRLIFPERVWPEILLHFNQEAIEASAKAGIELIPPKKPVQTLKPITEEGYNKLKTEIGRLKGIIRILTFALYFSLKIASIVILLRFINIGFAHLGVFGVFIALGGILIIFAAPLGIMALLNRWARLDIVEE